MANFTDAISQFNPYVEQLPVDAMAQVGMYKQAKYDEGVQKIQSQIDKISGLSVLHPEDKLYIQSKINEVTDKLKRFSTADFSNQQIVSSVSGMTSRLLNDKNILSAVETTANLKKQKEYQEKAISENKSSPSNDAYFEDGIEKYLQTKDPVKRNAFKNFKYVPYTDLSKKWTELIKSINPNATKEDIGKAEDFIDKDGKFQAGKIYEVMTRISNEGVSMEQIENAIRATLTDNDLLQLKIDANYRFRGIDSEKMKNHLKGDYDEKLKTIDGLEKSLNQYKETVKNNSAQIVATDKSLDKLKEKKNKLKSEYEENLSLANTDLESLKTNIYKEGTIFSFANSFSWEKKAKELLDNPYFETDMKLQQLAIDKARLQETVRQNNASNMYRNLELTQSKAISDRNYALELMKVNGQSNGFKVYLGQGLDNLPDVLTAKNNELINTKFQIENLKKQLGNNNLNVAETLIAKFKTNVNSITPQQRELVEQIIDLDKKALNSTIELQNAENEVLKNDPSLNEKVSKLNTALKTQKPLSITTISGDKYTFTPRQLLEYSRKMDKIEQMAYLANFMSPVQRDEYTLSILSPIEKILYKTSKSKNEDFRKIIQNQLSFYSKINQEDKLANQDFQDRLSVHLAEKDPNYIPVSSDIALPTEASRNYWETVAASALKKYNFEPFGIKGGSVYSSNADIVEAQNWLAGKEAKNLGYAIVMQGDNKFLDIHLGNKTVLVPLDPTQVNDLPKITGQPNSISEKINSLQISNGNYNTNPTGKVENSYYQPWNMNVKGLNVYADLSRNPNSSTQYITVNLTVDGINYPIQVSQAFPTIEGANNFIRSLTNKDIKDLFINDKSVPSNIKEKIKNL